VRPGTDVRPCKIKKITGNQSMRRISTVFWGFFAKDNLLVVFYRTKSVAWCFQEHQYKQYMIDKNAVEFIF